MGSRFYHVNRRIRQTGQVFENLIVMLLRAKFQYFRNDPIPEGSKTAEFVIDRNRDDFNSIIEDRQTIKISFKTMQKLEPVYNGMYAQYDNRYSFDGQEYILYGNTKPIITYNYTEGCKQPEVPDMAKIFGMPDISSISGIAEFQQGYGIMSSSMVGKDGQIANAPVLNKGDLTEIEQEVAANLFDDNFLFQGGSRLSQAQRLAYKKEHNFEGLLDATVKRLVERVPLSLLQFAYGKTRIHITQPDIPLDRYAPGVNPNKTTGVYYNRQIYLTPKLILGMDEELFDPIVHEFGHFLMHQKLNADEDYRADMTATGKEILVRLNQDYDACLYYPDPTKPLIPRHIAVNTSTIEHGLVKPKKPHEYFAESFSAFCDPAGRRDLRVDDFAMYSELKGLFPEVPLYEEI